MGDRKDESEERSGGGDGAKGPDLDVDKAREEIDDAHERVDRAADRLREEQRAPEER